MARLDLKLTFQCNNRCVFCVQGDKRCHEPDREHDQVRAEIADRRESCDGIVFTGGEVSLRSDLPEVIAHARALGYRTIQVQSNGRRMSYGPYLEALCDAGMTEFAPAIHGATSAVHDALTRARGSFVQSVRAVELARRRGVRVVLNSVIVQQNVHQLSDMVRLFARIGAAQSQLAFVHALGTAAQNFEDVVPRYSQLERPLAEALLLGERLGMRMMTEAVPFCFLRDLERFAAESVMPETAILDGGHVIASYADYRWQQGKARGPGCDACTFAGRCEGPWREYPERFGWDEFQPRQDAPPALLVAAEGPSAPA